MLRLLKKLIRDEKGQVLPAVLGLLVLGGLIIAPSINYVSTCLNSSRMINAGIRGTYAADAGIEDALWSLAKGSPPPAQLSENLNQMSVEIETENNGYYTLYLGELIEPGKHNDYLDVDGEMVWDEEEEAYKYTINITWQAEPGAPDIKLQQVGARIPVGYSYQTGSAANFEENLSTDEPDELLDEQDAYMLNWVLSPPLPSISPSNPVRTQTFYITGEGNPEGHYAWVVANRTDVGAVGEIAGAYYQITATATSPEDGRTTAQIVADVVVGLDGTYILSWQVLN